MSYVYVYEKYENPNMKKFTIIEMLVIIAIIGILASLMLPSLSKARLKVKQAVCLSNSKQIATATTSYIIDNDAYGPPDKGGKRWTDKLLGTYIDRAADNKPSPVFSCPTGYVLEQAHETNIAMNWYITGKDQSNVTVSSKPLMQATASETCLLTDNYTFWWSTTNWHMNVTNVIDEPNGGNIARHQLKANVTFLDGHAVAKTASFLLSKTDKNDTFWDVEQ